MTFEEFFKKKRIDVDALEKGNPALLFEFKNHFDQMGEKSFDHTKKYWFNKLRLQYHLAPEVKTEKVKIENQLAQQTITDSLAESSLAEPRSDDNAKFTTTPIAEGSATESIEEKPVSKPAAGFTPRFKAGATKPAQPAAQSPEESKTEEAAPMPQPKVGFTPRFKAGVTKPTEPTTTTEEKNNEEPTGSDKPKVGFTPRFKAGIKKPVDEPADLNTEESKTEEPAKSKVGFTPRFKAGVTKPAEEPAAPNTEESKTEEPAKSKVGFTPRFKAGVTKHAEPNPSTEANKTEEPAADKPKGFTPRFKAGVTKSAEPSAATDEIEGEHATAPVEEVNPKETPAQEKPKIGFTPRFKASAPPKQQNPPTEE